MKNFFYLLTVFFVLFVTQHVWAQLPSNVRVSNGSNEYWYYIQNGANPLVNRVTPNFLDNGSLNKAGWFMTSRGGNGSSQVFGYVYNINQNKDLQLWKVVDAGSGSYSLINKKTGNKMALGTGTTTCQGEDGVNCKDLFYTNTDGNASFEIKVIGDKSNFAIIKRVGSTNKLLAVADSLKKFAVLEADIEDEYDLPTNEVIMKSEKAWIFVSEADMAARPYPQLSTAGNEKWYTIDMISTNANYNGRVLFAKTSGANSIISRIAKDANPASADSSLWKFLPVPGENAQVYIVNKRYPNLYLGHNESYGLYSDAKPFLLKDIRNGELGIMAADKNWNHGGKDGITFTTATVNSFMGIGTVNAEQTTAWNYVSTYKFTLVNGSPSGIHNVGNDSFTVYVENGYVKSTDPNANLNVYTISGQKLDAKKQLPKGVYIVRSNTSSRKVIVR